MPLGGYRGANLRPTSLGASPTRIFFSQSQCSLSFLSTFWRTPDGYLRRLARDVIFIPKTLNVSIRS